MANMKEKVGNMNTRQKAMAGVFAVIVIVILWQAYSMFGGGFGATPVQAPPPAALPPSPKVAEVVEQPVTMTAEQQQMIQIEQQTQVKYVAALNELQMLKVAQELVETNQKIMKAKEDTVTSQKKILDMLMVPDAPPPPSRADLAAQNDQNNPVQPSAPKVSYTVVSVSQIQNKWGAVLSFGSNLYSVHTGDTLPADGSTIVGIDKNGVMLEKDGSRSKLSMISSI